MNSVASFRSPTSTSGRPVCRFCLDDDESVSRLINPCNCRGTVALLHPSCLEMWVDKSKNMICQMCQIAYEQESVAFKKMSEWTLPTPPLEPSEKLLFYATFVWIVYMILLLFFFVTCGLSGLLQWIDSHYLVLYSLLIIQSLIPYTKHIYHVVITWYRENLVYKFKDTCTVEERRELDEIQGHPCRCRFCPDGVMTVAHLIRPCRCPEIAIHSECVERFFGFKKMTDAWRCTKCKTRIQQQKVGLRKFTELTWPGPSSNAPEEIVDFCMSCCYTVYFFRILKVWISIGSNEMLEWMISHAYWIYWGLLPIISLALGLEAFVIAHKWHAENTAYKFKDRGAVSEKKTAISKASEQNRINND